MRVTARLLPPLAWVVASLASASVACAHGTDDHSERWTHWSWDPLPLIGIALCAALYGASVWKMWSRAGRGRGVAVWQVTCFTGGIVALVLALVSPLDPMSDQLQSAHMVQHMLLMMVAAPLLVLGSPSIVTVWALPGRWRRQLGRWWGRLESWRSPWYLLWQPLLLWVAYAGALWVWHLPSLYHAALRDEYVHHGQHLMFLVASCLFWRLLMDPISRLRMPVIASVFYLFTTSLHATLLGAFMALSPRVWYGDYVGRTEAWNLTPLEDQQVAGLIMWMPACMIYAVVAAVLFALWLRRYQVTEPAVVAAPSACAPQ